MTSFLSRTVGLWRSLFAVGLLLLFISPASFASAQSVPQKPASGIFNYLVDAQDRTRYAQVIAEYDAASAAPLRVYAYELDLISQTVPKIVPEPNITHYYGYDGHGNVRMLFDDQVDGATIETDRYDYDAFGILVWVEGNATDNDYLYAGEQWDDDLRLYYLRARYYSPDVGRFWSMDTYEGVQADPASLHKYLYCAADPVNNIDPSGHATEGLGGLTTSMGSISGLASQSIGAVSRAYVHTLVRLPQIMEAGQRVLLWAEFIGGLAGIGATIGPEVIDAAANVAERVDQAFNQNSQSISPGWATRGRQIEAMAGLAIEQDGGKFLGGNVKGIDAQLAVTKGDVLVSIKSHNLSADRLLTAIEADLKKLSDIDMDSISGTTHQGGRYFRDPGAAAGKIAIIAVPESQARHIISPEFVQKMRQFAQQTRTIPIVRAVRGFK